MEEVEEEIEIDQIDLLGDQRKNMDLKIHLNGVNQVMVKVKVKVTLMVGVVMEMEIMTNLNPSSRGRRIKVKEKELIETLSIQLEVTYGKRNLLRK